MKRERARNRGNRQPNLKATKSSKTSGRELYDNQRRRRRRRQSSGSAPTIFGRCQLQFTCLNSAIYVCEHMMEADAQAASRMPPRPPFSARSCVSNRLLTRARAVGVDRLIAIRDYRRLHFVCLLNEFADRNLWILFDRVCGRGRRQIAVDRREAVRVAVCKEKGRVGRRSLSSARALFAWKTPMRARLQASVFAMMRAAAAAV